MEKSLSSESKLERLGLRPTPRITKGIISAVFAEGGFIVRKWSLTTLFQAHMIKVYLPSSVIYSRLIQFVTERKEVGMEIPVVYKASETKVLVRVL